MESNTGISQRMRGSDKLLDTRRTTYGAISTQLGLLSDRRLSELLEKSPVLHSGIGGNSVLLTLEGTPIFVKKIPLTDLERQPENILSTANMFGLPLYCQYPVGYMHGFGAWRELATHTMTTNWVLAGTCPNFPLMYHWRVLPVPPPEPMNAEQLEALEQSVTYWEGSSAVRARLEAVQNASAEVVMFLEYFPETLYKWFGDQITKGGDASESATIMVDHNLKEITSFINGQGLLHFDAHFFNIMTDGQRLYFADFGLALSSRFDLSKAELEFFEQHRNYDRGYGLTFFLYRLIEALFGRDNWEKILREFATGQSKKTLTPSATSIITRYAQIAVLMRDFDHQLKIETKTTPYPVRELERLCASADL